MLSVEQLLKEIAKLPEDWHLAGSVSIDVLYAIVKHVGTRQVSYSMETGTGKTTLLFSHLSQKHRVFIKEDGSRSMSVVRGSPLFNPTTVEFIEGPSQITLPRFSFEQKLQIAFLDGPHAYPFPDLEYYHVYPHLVENSILIVDDIHIPTIRHLFDFLKEDKMFKSLEVVNETAFFMRTGQPLFDPTGDGWGQQEYNKKRFPLRSFGTKLRLKLEGRLPTARSKPR